MKTQRIGLVVVLASVIILSLLIYLKLQTDNQMLTACEQACGESDSVTCNLKSCPYHQNSNLSWVFIVMSILVAFTGGTGIYLSLPKKAEKIVEEKVYDLSKLSDEEKKIFLFIKDHREGVYQSHILKEFNLSKVQATRLLDKLESFEFIERRRRGLANKVQVK